VRVVLLGPPNVGKSSLMNALAGEEVAIVTDVPGTTRDALRKELIVDGIPVHVVDTAGLRKTEDKVERIGVERSRREIAQADIALMVSQAGDREMIDLPEVPSEVPDWAKKIFIFNKIDLTGEVARRDVTNSGERVFISAKTGEGMDLLRDAILAAAGWQMGEEAPFMARERHLAALQRTSSALARADASSGQIELFAEELRQAQQALSAITGEVSADELLGEIFSRFCIGK
jgi:tRNA modification GTPase